MMNTAQPLNEEIRQPMQQMMNRGEIKVGESGPVNWTQGAKCQRILYPQMSQSIWNPNKLELKQKIEGSLLQQRQTLGLWKDANRMSYAMIPFYLGMLVTLIIYVVLINQATDNDDIDSVLALVYIYILVILFLMFGAMGLQCYFISNMRDKVQTSICFMNQQLSNEGLNVTVVLRKKCPFPSVLNFSHVDVYERSYY